MMENNLLNFDMPQLINPYDRDEILCNLESLALSAFRISGRDDIGCDENDMFNTASYDDPVDVYENSYDELLELVGGYNYFVNENRLNEPLIRLVVDDEKTGFLKDGSQYPIYKVVLCDEPK